MLSGWLIFQNNDETHFEAKPCREHVNHHAITDTQPHANSNTNNIIIIVTEQQNVDDANRQKPANLIILQIKNICSALSAQFMFTN